MSDHETDGLLGRLKHPFFGPLTAFLVGCNWEFFYYVFTTKEEPLQAIAIAKNVYLDGLWEWAKFFGYPFALTWVFIVLAPTLRGINNLVREWINAWFEKWAPISNEKHKRELSEHQQKFDDLQRSYSQVAMEMEKFREAYNYNQGAPVLIDGTSMLPVDVISNLQAQMRQRNDLANEVSKLRKQVADLDASYLTIINDPEIARVLRMKKILGK